MVPFMTHQKNKKTWGQSLVEYALILALVSVVCAGTLTTLSGDIKTTLGNVSTAFETTGSNGSQGGPNEF